MAPRQLKAFIDQDLLDGPLKPIDYIDGDRTIRMDQVLPRRGDTLQLPLEFAGKEE